MEILRNPFDQSFSARYVTASIMKRQFALSYGIPIDTSDTKIKLITEAEQEFGNGQHSNVIVFDAPHDIPYPLRTARQKAQGLNTGINSDGYYIVSDVVWAIQSEDGSTFNLNKPKADPQREKQLIEIFDCLRGRSVSSNAGIALINPDFKHIDYYYTSLTMGSIRPNLDLSKLHNIIRIHSNYSGGLNFELMTQHVINLFEDFRFIIRNVSIASKTSITEEKESTELTKGSERTIYFSSDGTNFPLAKIIAIGIIPPDLSF